MADDIRNTVIAIVVSIVITESLDAVGVQDAIRELIRDIKDDF